MLVIAPAFSLSLSLSAFSCVSSVLIAWFSLPSFDRWRIAAFPPDHSRLMTETAFLMTHDSATGVPRGGQIQHTFVVCLFLHELVKPDLESRAAGFLDGHSHPTGVGDATYDEWMKTQTAPACAVSPLSRVVALRSVAISIATC